MKDTSSSQQGPVQYIAWKYSLVAARISSLVCALGILVHLRSIVISCVSLLFITMSNCCCKNASTGFIQKFVRQVTVAPFVFCKGFLKGYLLPWFSPSSSFNSVSIIYWWSICIIGCLTGCERNAPLHSLASPLTNFTFCYESKSWFFLEEVSGVYRVM